MKFPLQAILHLLSPRCAITGGSSSLVSGGGSSSSNSNSNSNSSSSSSISSGVWKYQEYGDGVLNRTAEALALQGEKLTLVKCNVREETKSAKGILTQEDAMAYNRQMHNHCKNLSKFVTQRLIKGTLKVNHSSLQDHERALHVMLFEKRDCSGLAWMAKLSKIFIEQCIVGQDQAKDGLQEILHSISITNPINPSTKEEVVLTGSLAYLQQLFISHTHHLQQCGGSKIYDCNPNNFHFENQRTNLSKKSCSRFFWRRQCQCDKPCHPRGVLLTKDRFEHEVQTQLVMPVGFWPGSSEVTIRTNIRDEFIAHLQRNNQVLPPYLSDDNQECLLQPQYSHLENMRHRDRFDMNAPGKGIYCPRQDKWVKFQDILTGQANVPVGLIEDLEEKLVHLKPVNAKVQVTIDTNDADRSVPGGVMNQDELEKENLHQMQRVLAMCTTLKMLVSGVFITDHPDMAMEERAVNAVVYDRMLDYTVQVIEFTTGNGFKTIRNRYLEDLGKPAFHVSLPRLLKTLQIFIDHHDTWLKMGNADAVEQEQREQSEWLGEGDGDGNVGEASNGECEDGEETSVMAVDGDGDGSVGDDAASNRAGFADPSAYLKFTSINSATDHPLTPQLAKAQVLNASHKFHPDSNRRTNPIKVQLGGIARDANPDNVLCEEYEINLNRGICSLRPSITCTGECMCHPTYPCGVALYKLDERYVIDNTLLHAQLGPYGRYPDTIGDISKILKEVLDEVKEAYACQDKDVPEFVGIREMYNRDGVFLSLCYPCGTCGKRYITLEEADYCCMGMEQVSNPNQDDRTEVNLEQLNANSDYQKQMLDLFKEWGVYDSSLIMKNTTSFKLNSVQIQYNMFKVKGRFVAYCEKNNVPINILKKCIGNKFGCCCQLHNATMSTSSSNS